MADLKISQLTSATTPLAGTEVVPLVQSSTTKKVSVADLTAGRAVSVGSLAVGAATATYKLDVQTSGGLFQVQNYGAGSVLLYSSGVLAYNAATTRHEWQIGGTPYLYLDSNGNLIPQVAGKGVNFTANTPAAGMTSQLLNCYEEGTWTPLFTSLTTVGTVAITGQYTLIGKMCFCTIAIVGATGADTSASVAGTTLFTGLPFTAAGVNSTMTATNGAIANLGVGLVTSTNSYPPAWAATQNVWLSFCYRIS